MIRSVVNWIFLLSTNLKKSKNIQFLYLYRKLYYIKCTEKDKFILPVL